MRSRAILLLVLTLLAGSAAPAAAAPDCLVKSGQKAIRACTTIIEDKSSTLDMRIVARRYRAAAYSELGKYRPAIADMDAIIGTGKALARDWWQRGTAQYFLGDYGKALAISKRQMR